MGELLQHNSSLFLFPLLLIFFSLTTSCTCITTDHTKYRFHATILHIPHTVSNQHLMFWNSSPNIPNNCYCYHCLLSLLNFPHKFLICLHLWFIWSMNFSRSSHLLPFICYVPMNDICTMIQSFVKYDGNLSEWSDFEEMFWWCMLISSINDWRFLWISWLIRCWWLWSCF